MSCLTKFTLCAVKGDTFHKPLTLSTWDATTEQFTPNDLTGVTAVFALAHERTGVPEFLYDDTPEITFPDRLGGELLLSIPAVETREWHARAVSQFKQPPSKARYEYQLRLTWPDGVVETILTGTLEVLLAVIE